MKTYFWPGPGVNAFYTLPCVTPRRSFVVAAEFTDGETETWRQHNSPRSESNWPFLFRLESEVTIHGLYLPFTVRTPSTGSTNTVYILTHQVEKSIPAQISRWNERGRMCVCLDRVRNDGARRGAMSSSSTKACQYMTSSFSSLCQTAACVQGDLERLPAFQFPREGLLTP